MQRKKSSRGWLSTQRVVLSQNLDQIRKSGGTISASHIQRKTSSAQLPHHFEPSIKNPRSITPSGQPRNVSFLSTSSCSSVEILAAQSSPKTMGLVFTRGFVATGHNVNFRLDLRVFCAQLHRNSFPKTVVSDETFHCPGKNDDEQNLFCSCLVLEKNSNKIWLKLEPIGNAMTGFIWSMVTKRETTKQCFLCFVTFSDLWKSWTVTHAVFILIL